MKDIQKFWKRVRKLPNVVGYSQILEPRIRQGRAYPEEMCFRVYVSKKVIENLLIPKDIIPKSLGATPVDVVEVGKIKALELDPKKEYRPCPAGVSIGHKSITAGTLGYFALKDDKILLLSNNHVLSNSNAASPGDEIYQPGPADGGTKQNTIATLHSFIPLKFSEYSCPFRQAIYKLYFVFAQDRENLVDAALALPNREQDIKLEIINNGVVTGKKETKVGDKLQKYGRTTGRTSHGIVEDVNYSGYVDYERGKVFFVDQILIKGAKFSQGGDSGSLIMTMDNKATGLLFAGSEQFTLANKLENVEKLLGVRIIES